MPSADGVPWIRAKPTEFIIPAIFDDTHHLLWLKSSNVRGAVRLSKNPEQQSVVALIKVSTAGNRKQELKTLPGGVLMKSQIFLCETQDKEIRRRNLINLFWQRFRESLSFRQGC